MKSETTGVSMNEERIGITKKMKASKVRNESNNTNNKTIDLRLPPLEISIKISRNKQQTQRLSSSSYRLSLD